jgi:hypothetical protein
MGTRPAAIGAMRSNAWGLMSMSPRAHSGQRSTMRTVTEPSGPSMAAQAPHTAEPS